MTLGTPAAAHRRILVRWVDTDTRRRAAWRAAVIASLVCSLALALSVPVSVAATLPGPSSFSEGFLDLPTLESLNASVREKWLGQAKALGATAVRFGVDWASIAPKRLTRGFHAANPGDPRYDWYGLDGAIRDASADGLSVLLTLWDAPGWAQASHRPRTLQSYGGWRPSARELGSFARALATRYSGHYPDPLHYGEALPRVAMFQAWNEPNLPNYLDPQWTRGNGGVWIPASPAIYRALLNAVYANVKAVQPDAFVLSAGTAPYGNPPGGRTMSPVLFTSELLCLHGAALHPEPCPDPAHFDALDHHPYSATPTLPARNPGDVSVPDLGKLERILRVAERTGRALPRGPKSLWITEIGWGSKPPNPNGVSLAVQARYLALAFYTLWRQGVSHVFWFTLRDQGGAFGGGGGLYFGDGKAKPSAAAFRFPFVAIRGADGRLTLWGRAPVAGLVSVESRVGNSWRIIGGFSTTSGGVFYAKRKLGDGDLSLRAVEGDVASPVWSTG